MNTVNSVLEIKDLKTFFYTREGVARAVNGVSVSLSRGEILGVVGESGCGKSLTALSTLRLVPHPGRIVSGEICLGGVNLLEFNEKQMRKIRGDRISMIFQEPMISLNPAFNIENQLVEAVQAHRRVTKAEAINRAIEMLKLVEIPAPERRIKDYPHQLSGGMRQRVMIAEALLLDPEVLLADEPTTALDVTIQAQILDIMYRLNQDTGTAIVLITHNLGLVAESAKRVVVMYAGKVVEEGPAVTIFDCASHPYTQGLLKSLPKPRRSLLGKKAPLYEMTGIVPSLFDLPAGCAFHPRCPSAMEICRQQEPPKFEAEPGHYALCWLFA